MRLPRWLVLSMLTVSVLAVLGALGAGVWWWVTWPERTVREYIALSLEGDFEQVDQMTEPKRGFVPFESDEERLRWRARWSSLRVEPAGNRTLIGVILGRQNFRTAEGDRKSGPFTVQRGKVLVGRALDLD